MTVAHLAYGFARRFGVVVTGATDTAMSVALRNGEDPRVLIEVRRIAGRPLVLNDVDAATFDRLLAEAYAGDGAAAADAMGELPDTSLPTMDLLDPGDEAPVIRLLNGLIAQAVRHGASDIHIEPHSDALVVRMRIDGSLGETLRLPASASATVTSRIKIMARLDIAERRLPQDGRITLALGDRTVDVRVATLPARGGERVVLRLLDPAAAARGLGELGMSPAVAAEFAAALDEPNGLVLVTGPTGAGKTTTLYAALKRLNNGSRNILTIEDPVEYAVDGVSQTQVNARVGLDFAAGLRAVLRQDPDTVMIGEIRDSETAGIAVQAALTGHLVLSSVHANSAVGAVTRLRDIGIEPYLLAAGLRVVVAQRLLRRLCPACAVPTLACSAAVAGLGLDPGAIVAIAGGCPSCEGSGFSGRLGIFELLRVDGGLRRLIHEGADEATLATAAFNGRPALVDTLREAVLAHHVLAEEALRTMRMDGDNASMAAA